MELKKLPNLALLSLALALPLAACGGSDENSNSTDPCGGRCLSTQVCDDGQCVECTANAHCQALDAAKPVCRMSDNICVQCVTKDDCAVDGFTCKNSRCIMEDPSELDGGISISDGGEPDANINIPDGGEPDANDVTSDANDVPQDANDVTPDAGPQPECTGDEECPGTDVCENEKCQICRLGTCNTAGDSKCAADLSGDTDWELCESGVCSGGTCQPVTVDDGIEKARAAVTGKTDAEVSIPIKNALVTYVRDDGFFIQASPTGPAIFVNSDAGSGTPAVGDRVSLTATSVKMHEVRRITAYEDYSKTASGTVPAAWIQDLSDVSDITTVEKYESELVELAATLTTNFNALGSAGTGFKKAGIKTDGYTPATPSIDFVLRLPEDIAAAITSEAAKLGKTPVGCIVYVSAGLYWGYDTSTFAEADGCTNNCNRNDTQISMYSTDIGDYLFECANAEDDPNAPPTNFDAHESWKGLTTETSSPFSSQDVSGVTWTYTATPYAAASSATRPFSPGFVLPSGKHLTSSAISGGIKELTVAFGKGSNSNDVRCIKVTVNGTTYKSEPFSSTSAVPYTLFKVPNINAAGSASPTIKIEMNGDTADNCKNTQLMIGDIWWTNN